MAEPKSEFFTHKASTFIRLMLKRIIAPKMWCSLSWSGISRDKITNDDKFINSSFKAQMNVVLLLAGIPYMHVVWVKLFLFAMHLFLIT